MTCLSTVHHHPWCKVQMQSVDTIWSLALPLTTHLPGSSQMENMQYPEPILLPFGLSLVGNSLLKTCLSPPLTPPLCTHVLFLV